MRVINLFAVVTLTLMLPLRAERVPLKRGVSPDGRFEVFASEIRNEVGASLLAYVIVSRASGRILLRIASSYEDPANQFDLNQTREAVVRWSADSHFAAIDEAVHRYIGELFLVRFSHHHAVRLELPKAAILKRTQEPWDRVSMHQPKWTSANHLSVYLHGLLPPPEAEHKEFEILLHILPSERISIERVRQIKGDGA